MLATQGDGEGWRRKYVTGDVWPPNSPSDDIPTRSTWPASTRGKVISRREGLDRRVVVLHPPFCSRAGHFYTAPLVLPKLCLKSVKCGGHCWFRTNIMPQDRHPSQDAFDINLLDSQVLDTPDALQTVLRAVEAVCHRGDPETTTMVATLNSRSHILEYIISGTSRVLIGSCEPPAPIILPTSTGRRGVRKALEMDNYRVPHVRNAKNDGYHEHAAPPETLILVAVRGVSIRCRCTPRPPRILEKGGTLVRCSEES